MQDRLLKGSHASMVMYESATNASEPTEMKLELTRRCPLSCLHCSASAGPCEQLAVTPRDARRLIREFAVMGGKTLVLTGGEPLNHPDIVGLAAFAKTVQLHTVLYTTGLKNDLSLAADALLNVEEYVDSFLLCLHGATPSIHDRITGVKGSHGATMSAIRFLRTRRKVVSIHHVPLLLNRSELPALCEIVMEFGLDSLKILRFVPQGRGETNEAELLLGSTGVMTLAKEIRSTQQRFPSIRIDLGAPYSMLASGRDIMCGLGTRTLSVGADLDCYPCDGLKEVHHGAFRESLVGKSLREWWEQSTVLKSIRQRCGKAVSRGGSECLAQALLADDRLSSFARNGRGTSRSPAIESCRDARGHSNTFSAFA